MTKNKKIINHKFLDRSTILGAVLLMAWGMIFSEGIFSLPAAFVARLLSPEGNYDWISSFCCAAGALVLLAIHKRWFYPEYAGSLGKDGLVKTLRVSWFILAFWALGFVKEIIFGTKFQVLSLSNFAMSVMAGFCEEAAFRGLAGSYLMRQWKEDRILAAVLLTSAGFGLLHGLNILSGAAVGITLMQVVSTFFIGVFFCAVYYRGGNLWPLMIMHTIHDILAFLTLAEGATLTHAIGLVDWVDTALNIMLGAAGFYLIRKEKRGEIAELWARKWNKKSAEAD